MNKLIANVVFYKFWDPTTEGAMQQACIFYEDGTVKNVSLEEGLEAAYEIAKADKIKTQAELTNLINTKRVYTLSGKEFEDRFQEFIGKGVALVPAQEIKPTVIANPQQQEQRLVVLPQENKKEAPVAIPQENKSEQSDNINITPVIIPAEKQPVEPSAIPEIVPENESKKAVNNEKNIPPVVPIIIPPVNTSEKSTPAAVQESVEKPIDEPVGAMATPASGTPSTAEKKVEEANKGNKKKKKGIFSRLWAKVTAVVLAIAIAFTGGFHLGRNTKCGDIINNNITSITSQDNDEIQDQAFLNLIKKSTNKDQKAAMTHQGESLDVFNRDFANAHLEEGKDVKAGLTWDEMMALNIAYNTYTKDQIRIMFNGSEVDSTAMSNAYKNATLQLMGAYVISDREHPVKSSEFLIDEEQKAFVEKYNDLFLTMKEKTGEERVAAIDAFYAELYKDFPIADEVREEGISHADSRRLVEPYKAAVTPIVAAAEIMFQNTDGIDHTLSDKAIAYFNDLGLCNLVDEQFERAETITLTAETDENQPLYQDFRQAKIAELIYEGNYPTDDAHRDLSQLDEFQKWVNGYFLFENGVNTGKITRTVVTTYTTTTTHTETTTHETSNREEAVAMAGEEAVKKAEEAADQQIAAENAAAKAEAERKAAEEAARQQAIADAEREKHEAEVEADDEEMQDMIEDANDEINHGGKVNEDDFGDHNVDFDNDNSDNKGNLDDSVTDITTDGTGAVDEYEPLPDPNQTGAQFDAEANYGTTWTNEQIVDAYIASLEEGSENTSGQEIYEYEEPYQYTK